MNPVIINFFQERHQILANHHYKPIVDFFYLLIRLNFLKNWIKFYSFSKYEQNTSHFKFIKKNKILN